MTTQTVQPSGDPVSFKTPGSLQHVTTGLAQVAISGAVQLPDIHGSLVRLKAGAANAGIVYVGPDTVTPAGTEPSVAAGFPLAAGDDTGWMPLDNLNHFYITGENGTDVVSYIVI